MARDSFGAEDLRNFLGAVDRHLTHPTRLLIIGGSAAALAHQATSTTEDIDTNEQVPEGLKAAARLATLDTGLQIPIATAAVAELPYHFEERLERQLPELKMLEVWVLEKHDLVLSKTVRADEHDLQQIREIHQNVGLIFLALVQRFRDEMSYAVGDPEIRRQRFLWMIEVIFGELSRVEAERRLPPVRTA